MLVLGAPASSQTNTPTQTRTPTSTRTFTPTQTPGGEAYNRGSGSWTQHGPMTLDQCLVADDANEASWRTCPAGLGAAFSFVTWDAPAGTDPVADAASDTMTLAGTGILTITGDATTDTLTFDATEIDGSITNEIQNLFETIDASSGTDPVADSATDTLVMTGTSPLVVTGDSAADSVTFSCPTCATGSHANSFETWAVPAGTNPVADSATDTITFTEQAGLDITGTAASDTIDFKFDSTEVGTTTWGSGSPFTWTFDIGTLDPTMAFDELLVTLNSVWKWTVGGTYYNDTIPAVFGTGGDATLYYDGTDLLLNPRSTGTGDLALQGNLRLADTARTYTASFEVLDVNAAETLDVSAGTLYHQVWQPTVTFESDPYLLGSVVGYYWKPTIQNPSAESRTYFGLLVGNYLQPMIQCQTGASAYTCGATIYSGYYDAPTIGRTGTGTYTVQQTSGFTSGIAVDTGATVTTRIGFAVNAATGAGSIGTQIGLDIANLTKGSTANIGIRNASTTVWKKQSVSVADNGNPGTAATFTLSPTATYVQITCNDNNSCDGTMSETGIQDGQILMIDCVAAGGAAATCDFSDSAGVQEMGGPRSLSNHDSLWLRYDTDHWQEVLYANIP